MSKRLSPETERCIQGYFPPEGRAEVAKLLLHECGNNLPFLEKLDEFELERVRFAALKLSRGNLDSLKQAIKLAKSDWHELLIIAGFGGLNDHKHWFPAENAS